MTYTWANSMLHWQPTKRRETRSIVSGTKRKRKKKHSRTKLNLTDLTAMAIIGQNRTNSRRLFGQVGNGYISLRQCLSNEVLPYITRLKPLVIIQFYKQYIVKALCLSPSPGMLIVLHHCSSRPDLVSVLVPGRQRRLVMLVCGRERQRLSRYRRRWRRRRENRWTAGRWRVHCRKAT